MIGYGVVKTAFFQEQYEIVADRIFGEMFETSNPILLDAAEDKKNLQSVEKVILELRSRGLQRGGHIVAVGGGVIQDVSTLVASLYMRGVDWTYAPTTLMAMTDSCIGGKSSINAGNIKNLIGNIYPPKQVLIDPDFVGSLSPSGIASGLAEAVKIAYCRSPETFDRYMTIAGRNAAVDYVEMLRLVLSAKKWFIEKDEFDKAERRLLNFGHTFGHALEVGTRFAIPHGVAVALGIQAAIEFVSISRELNHNEKILLSYVMEVVEMAGLGRDVFSSVDDQTLIEAFKADKKHARENYRLILPVSDGGVDIVNLSKTDETIKAVARAIHLVMRRYQ